MDKIGLELGTFGEFATTVLQTLAKRCHHVISFFFESATEINGARNGLKKAISTDDWDHEIRFKPYLY